MHLDKAFGAQIVDYATERMKGYDFSLLRVPAHIFSQTFNVEQIINI